MMPKGVEEEEEEGPDASSVVKCEVMVGDGIREVVDKTTNDIKGCEGREFGPKVGDLFAEAMGVVDSKCNEGRDGGVDLRRVAVMRANAVARLQRVVDDFLTLTAEEVGEEEEELFKEVRRARRTTWDERQQECFHPRRVMRTLHPSNSPPPPPRSR